MKGTILVNPYDVYPVQRRKTERMREELSALGVEVSVAENDGFAAYVAHGKVRCALETDFVLYFDKDRIAARLLEKAGIRLFNRAAATEICDDKMLTHVALANSGIPMPDTIAGPLCYNPAAVCSQTYVQRVVSELGLPVVVKKCHGSFGEQVYLCGDEQQLKAVLDSVKTEPYLLQRYESASCGRDMRVIVIGGKAVCAMIRKNSGDFRSNAALGAVCEKADVPPDIAAMCEKAARIVGLDFCGADVLLTDPPKLCELNSNAMFEKMEQVTGFNVGRAYAQHIVRCVSMQK